MISNQRELRLSTVVLDRQLQDTGLDILHPVEASEMIMVVAEKR
jgi:hypothetical protein